ncbi:hypothetical protein [Rhodoblastus sp.]|uniref:hypothetical protein n=1 Tax=Rhodoblastus sp. TaxID=1962975 RepID=UPI003FD745EE
MSAEVVARLKLTAIIGQVRSILNSDIPFENVGDALQALLSVLLEFEPRLDKAIRLKDNDGTLTTIRNINQKILQVLPTLGFILRSTNVRNAFELLDPLQSLARAFLKGKSKILLSSEWDYIPFAYPQSIADLPTFTFIGLPASECSNLLIFPLAGHELGHSVWRQIGLESEFYADVFKRVSDTHTLNLSRFGRVEPRYKKDLLDKDPVAESIANSTAIALAHCEEVFCDLFGLALFGQSYILAFAYILSPGLGSERDMDYPTHMKRAEILVKYAEQKMRISSQQGFPLQFRQEEAKWTPRAQFDVDIAEKATIDVVDSIWTKVDKLVKAAKVKRPDAAHSNAIVDSFRENIPHADPKSLGNIINASWLRFDEIVSKNGSFDEISYKLDRLNEMGLKTVEALEYRRRVKE